MAHTNRHAYLTHYNALQLILYWQCKRSQVQLFSREVATAIQYGSASTLCWSHGKLGASVNTLLHQKQQMLHINNPHTINKWLSITSHLDMHTQTKLIVLVQSGIPIIQKKQQGML